MARNVAPPSEPVAPEQVTRPAVRIGLVLWALQALYVPIELAVAAAVRAPYDLAHNTVSELGAVTCARYGDAQAWLDVCSPGHPMMNATFVVSGVALVVAAPLVRPLLRGRFLGPLAAVLWAFSGLCSIATGFLPLDVSLDLHLLVSNPLFVVQPLAVLVATAALPGRHRVLAATGVATGVLAAVASAVFLAGGLAELPGLLERLSLWPSTLWLAACGIVLLRRAGTRRTERHGPDATVK